MTDTFDNQMAVPSRLGTSARLDDGRFVIDLVPRPETLHHGIVRASVLAFVIDAVAGIVVDDEPDTWMLTSDLSVRMRPVPAPELVVSSSTTLRRGRRSVTCKVELTDDTGTPVATGAVGFATVARRPTDPPKPVVSPEQAVGLFADVTPLTRPLRDEAGIEVLDAAEGVVQMAVSAKVRNPAGTLQGAMVALLAEAAVEEMVATRFESPVVVTDLDVRYLAPAPVGPVRTTSRLLGSGPDAPVEVELTDLSAGRLTTLVYARATGL